MTEDKTSGRPQRGTGGTKTGLVVSNAMQKTVVVEVGRLVAHPLYRRTLRSSMRFLAHDEKQQCKVGDLVTIRECRPLSRRKRWTLHVIVRPAARSLAEVAALEKRLASESEPK